MPSERATESEVRISADPMSTRILAFISFG